MKILSNQTCIAPRADFHEVRANLVERRLTRLLITLIVAMASCFSAIAQSLPAERSGSPVTQQPVVSSDSSIRTGVEGLVRVCRRPLPRWAGSKNWLLAGLNRLVVRHLHHSYISFANDVSIPSVGSFVRTVGIHPVGAANRNKQPMLDQSTDNLDGGGECKVVQDATPEKMQRLIDEITADTCHSCGNNYHNRALSGCYNNSNTYVYDLIKEAGMTPPKMKGAPGYRHHHACHLW